MAQTSPAQNPGIYDTMIAKDAKDVFLAQKDSIHKARRRDYAFFEAVERGIRQFISAVIEDTWIR